MEVSAGASPGDGSAGLVLVHGAGFGSWIWRDVVPALAAPAVAVDLPGRTAPADERSRLSFDEYLASVEAQIEAFPSGRFVLVAHSIAGVLAPRLLHAFRDRAAGFIGVGAAIPRGGGSFLSTLPAPKRYLMSAILRLLGTRPPDAVIRKSMCNDLEPDVAGEVVQRFVPEARALYATPAGREFPDLPRRYIVLEDDAELDVPLQRRMAENLGTSDLTSLDSGHLPMLSRPRELAALIDAFEPGGR